MPPKKKTQSGFLETGFSSDYVNPVASQAVSSHSIGMKMPSEGPEVDVGPQKVPWGEI